MLDKLDRLDNHFLSTKSPERDVAIFEKLKV
jgi:hypothetical protein